MPVERSRGHAGRALAVSGIAVALIAGGLWAVAVLTSRSDSLDVRLGDATFQGGSAERLADEIDDRGPIIYGDLSDGGSDERPIILQHLGDDPDEGWSAFNALVPGADDCFWVWQADEEEFRSNDGCEEDVIAPADGEGLEGYPVEVVDGTLDIDLNFEDRPTTTTAPPTTAVESGNVPSSTTEG